MRRKILELLQYPRERIHAHVMLVGCEEGGMYDEYSAYCHGCQDHDNCCWLRELDRVEHKATTVTPQLQARLLEHAIDQMNLQARYFAHDVHACNCPDCRWMRAARATLH